MIQRRTPLKRSTKPIKRSASPSRGGPPNRVNRKRRETAFARAYHSKARVRFVKGLPCAACGRQGASENAHAFGDGAGRKGPYSAVVPLCGGINGCHRVQHERGWFDGIGMTETSRQWAAKHTESLWQAYLSRGGEDVL